MDKLLGALGLARRAGALQIGFDAVCAAAQSGAAQLVLFAGDVSPGTKKRVLAACAACKAVTLPHNKAGLTAVTTKPAGVLAITDKDLATLCQKALAAAGAGDNKEETV